MLEGGRTVSQQRALPCPIPPFRPGGDFCLGAEEEILLVDAEGCLTDAGGAAQTDLELESGRPLLS